MDKHTSTNNDTNRQTLATVTTQNKEKENLKQKEKEKEGNYMVKHNKSKSIDRMVIEINNKDSCTYEHNSNSNKKEFVIKLEIDHKREIDLQSKSDEGWKNVNKFTVKKEDGVKSEVHHCGDSCTASDTYNNNAKMKSKKIDEIFFEINKNENEYLIKSLTPKTESPHNKNGFYTIFKSSLNEIDQHVECEKTEILKEKLSEIGKEIENEISITHDKSNNVQYQTQNKETHDNIIERNIEQKEEGYRIETCCGEVFQENHKLENQGSGGCGLIDI